MTLPKPFWTQTQRGKNTHLPGCPAQKACEGKPTRGPPRRFRRPTAWFAKDSRRRALILLIPPVVPCYPFLEEGSPTKIDYRKKGTLFLASLLEDLVLIGLIVVGGC